MNGKPLRTCRGFFLITDLCLLKVLSPAIQLSTHSAATRYKDTVDG